MRLSATLALFFIILLGCGREERPRRERQPMVLSDLGIEVRDAPRMFALSDKKGGFLVGTIGGDTDPIDARWTVFGKDLLRGIAVQRGDGTTLAPFASGVVYPQEVQFSWMDGSAAQILPLDSPEPGRHLLLLKVAAPVDRGLRLTMQHGDFLADPELNREAGIVRWNTTRGPGELALFFGGMGNATEDGLEIPVAGTATVLLYYSETAVTREDIREIHGRAEDLQDERAWRMTGLLNRAYLRTSDGQLTRGISWIRLTLDALLVEGRDTFFVAGFPWDGSVDGRVNAQAAGSMGFVTGDASKTASVIRNMADDQDTIVQHATYGRIALRSSRGKSDYSAADVTPLFVRAIYDYVTQANDTALVRSLYPALKRSIEGTSAHHTDHDNFLVHGRSGTWMSSGAAAGRVGPSRGDRAVEVQMLWHFQQLIGSYLAAFLGEWEDAERWGAAAETTAVRFAPAFIDTAKNLVYDHLLSDGTGVYEPRPNPVFCLDLIPSELIQQNVLRDAVRGLLYPHGVGTLGSSHARFKQFVGLEGQYSAAEAKYNGPVATWLTSQIVYGLTRYDRQDFCYPVTERMIHYALNEGMAGTLPEMFEVKERPGEQYPRGAGLFSYAPAAAEFLRSCYQDYLGIGVDGISGTLSLKPKLPDHLTEVDCTVFVGDVPVNVQYQIGQAVSRIVLEQAEASEELKVTFIWTMKSGNGWRGSLKLPGRPGHFWSTATRATGRRSWRQVWVWPIWLSPSRLT